MSARCGRDAFRARSATRARSARMARSGRGLARRGRPGSLSGRDRPRQLGSLSAAGGPPSEDWIEGAPGGRPPRPGSGWFPAAPEPPRAASPARSGAGPRSASLQDPWARSFRPAGARLPASGRRPWQGQAASDPGDRDAPDGRGRNGVPRRAAPPAAREGPKALGSTARRPRGPLRTRAGRRLPGPRQPFDPPGTRPPPPARAGPPDRPRSHPSP